MRRAKKVVKEIADEATPQLIEFAIKIVRRFDDGRIDKGERRELAVALIQDLGPTVLGVAVGENLARLLVEFALRALRKEGDAALEIGTCTRDEIAAAATAEAA